MTHLTERDRERGTREQRGYGPEFARQRRRYAARIAAGEAIPCWRCGQPVTTDYWQRGYQAGALQARTRASIAEGQRLIRELTFHLAALLIVTVALIATGWPWIAAITGVLCLVCGYLRWTIAQGIERLRTYLEEDQ